MKQIGTIIKTRRRMMGLTLRDVVNSTGLPFTVLGAIESNVNNPTPSQIKLIAYALGMFPSDLDEEPTE